MFNWKKIIIWEFLFVCGVLFWFNLDKIDGVWSWMIVIYENIIFWIIFCFEMDIIFNLRNLKFVEICLVKNRFIIRNICFRINLEFNFRLGVSLFFDYEFVMGIVGYVVYII